jgi:hypothetical protein
MLGWLAHQPFILVRAVTGTKRADDGVRAGDLLATVLAGPHSLE